MNNVHKASPSGYKGSTFVLRVLYRQNATWQGDIQWLDEKEGGKRFFRSLLEMIVLMNDALEREKV